jgi:hypothetical protein
MKRHRQFPTHRDEADAIDAMLEGNLVGKLQTCDPIRLALFRADASKAAAELRLLTSSQAYSQPANRHDQKRKNKKTR